MTINEEYIISKIPDWKKEGADLKKAREKAKISQVELAARMRVSPYSIRKIEDGRHIQRRAPIVICYRLALKDIISNRLSNLE